MSSGARNTRHKHSRKTKAQLVEALEKLERQVAEGELATKSESDNLFLNAIEGMREGLALYDVDGCLVAFNKEYQKIQPRAQEYLDTGKTFEEILLNNVKEGLITEAKGREEEFIKERLESHRHPIGPTARHLPNGEWYRHYETRLPGGETVISFINITEQKQAEEARLEIESRFRTIVDGAPMSISLKDENGKLLVGNKTLGAWTKTDPSIIVGKTAYDFFSKEVADKIFEHDRRVMKTGEESVREVTRTFPDGLTRTILIHKCPVRNASGEVAAVATIIADVTALKKAEEARLEIENRFRTIVDGAPLAISLKDKDGKLLITNKTLGDWTKTDPSTIAGMTSYDFFPKEEADKIFEHDRHAIETGKESVIEVTRTFPDGVTRTVLTHKCPVLSANGEVIALATIMADITELKQAEEARFEIESRFRAVVDGAPVAITLKDRNGNLLIGNKTLGAWTNTEPSMIAGMTLYDLYSKKIADEITERDRRVMESDKESVAEVTRTYADGVTRTILSHKCPVHSADGEVIALATILADITALKKAEQKILEDSETKFLESIESIPNGVLVLDKDDRFVLCNTAYRTHLDKIAHQLIPGTPFEELVRAVANADIVSEAKEDKEAYIRRRMDMHRSRKPFVHHIIETDRWVIIHDYDMSDGGVYHVRTDITEQKHAEEALRVRSLQQGVVAKLSQRALTITDLTEFLDETANLVASTLGAEYCGVMELLPDGTELLLRAGFGWKPGRVGTATVSTGKSSQAGYALSTEELVTIEDFRTDALYDDSPILRDHDVVSGMSIIIGDKVKPFGILGVHTTSHRVFTDDDVVFLKTIANVLSSVISRNLSEIALKKNEAMFRSATESLQEGFAIFDSDDRLVIWNDKYREMLVLDEEIVKPGATFEDLVRENVKFERVNQSVGRGEEFIRERIEQHRNPSGPFELTMNNGKSILVSEAKTPDGGIYITLIDITKLKLTERQAREREAELSNIRRLNVLGEMAAAVAHELNQPLTVISSYAQFVADKLGSGAVSPDDLRVPIENLADQANRAGEIIRSVRSLFSKQETQKAPVDINTAIEEAIVLLRPECEDLSIDITLDLDNGLPQALADKVQIQQLVLNLVRNSLEAMSESPSARSELTIRSFQNGGDSIEFEIKDTGPGFSPNEHESLFQPFFTTKTQGIGLGLSICRSIAEAHGGRIWIDRESGMGAAVHFSLPIADESQLEDA